MIKQKVASLCAFRERTRKEIFEKLKKYKLTDEEANQVMREMVEEKFIDEERYARSFCHDKFKFNKWGKIRIRYELQKKGISDRDIEAGMAVIGDDDYRAMAGEILQNKARMMIEADPLKFRNKLFRYMAGKGYEMEVIRDLYHAKIGKV
jgi:regulatory protein